MFVTACSGIVGETPVATSPDTVSDPSAPDQETTVPTPRECVQFTGGTDTVDTGSPAGDALFLAGEIFLCADDVVVVAPADLNEVAAGAQLAAALEGPLLYPHPQLAAEIGRLKPRRIHLIGGIDVVTPPDAEVATLNAVEAVEAAKQALAVTRTVTLPAVPDASTLVETIAAIGDGDRVAVPPMPEPTTTTPATPDIDTGELVTGLASSTGSNVLWVADASNPLSLLVAAANGNSVEASTIAIDSDAVLAYPEVGSAMSSFGPESIRFIGGEPPADEWEIAVLTNDHQVPGGGYYILPEDKKRRYVAFYGHPETSALGVLGEQGGEETIERMQPFLEAYEGDGAQTIPTFEIIATVAAAAAGEDGNYSYEWPISTFDDLVATSQRHDAYIVLDLQPGRTDFLTQAKRYEELLLLPNVGLAIDPEWRLAPDQVHLKQVGRVHSAEINEVLHWLGDLVRENGLPQKLVILHMFRTFMIQEREILVDRPELQVVIQMDGDGTEPQKDNTWATLKEGFEDAFWSWGWKNFFDEDEPGPPTPESTMAKEPSPVYVSYQ